MSFFFVLVFFFGGLPSIIPSLVVISEADVEREREMIADGADISDFDGYQKYKRNSTNDIQKPVTESENIPNDKIIKVNVDTKRIEKVEPEEEKIIQIDPDDF